MIVWITDISQLIHNFKWRNFTVHVIIEYNIDVQQKHKRCTSPITKISGILYNTIPSQTILPLQLNVSSHVCVFSFVQIITYIACVSTIQLAFHQRWMNMMSNLLMYSYWKNMYCGMYSCMNVTDKNSDAVRTSSNSKAINSRHYVTDWLALCQKLHCQRNKKASMPLTMQSRIGWDTILNTSLIGISKYIMW